MKEFKLNMTRPEFLKRILTNCDNDHSITEDDLTQLMHRGEPLPYCSYSALMEADIEPDDITYINIDDESVVVKLSSKQLAKRIKETCNKEMMRVGITYYKVKVKQDGTYVIITVTPDHTLADMFEE